MRFFVWCWPISALLLVLVIVLAAPTAPVHGQAAAPAQTLLLTFKQLGSDAPLANQGIWVLDRGLSGNTRQKITTDAKGQASLTGSASQDLRLFASGRFFIPYSWSRVNAANWSAGEKVVYARTMATITLTGTVTAKDGKAANNGMVEFAPLDVQEDGSFVSYERTYVANCDDHGAYEIELPAGYYDYWGTWADKSSEDWDSWFQLKRGQGIFQSATQDMTLTLQPIIEGSVIDGRTGGPIDARVDLVSTEHLSQKRLKMISDSEDEKSHLGVFRDRLHLIDQNDFSIIVRAADSSQAIRVYPNLNLAKALKLGPLKLYDKSESTLKVSLVTKSQKFPLVPGSIRILPSGSIEAPAAMREELLLLGYLDGEGEVLFSGLPKGTYAVYTNGGQDLLGDITITGKPQVEAFEYDLSFIYGKLEYPDGTPVKMAEFQIQAFDSSGAEYPLRIQDALRNPWLARKGMYMAGLGPSEIRYVFTFGAPAKDAETLPWDESPTEMYYISEPITIRTDEHRVQKHDIKLKINPTPKSRDD